MKGSENKTALVTGSNGLIGTELTLFLIEQGLVVHGLDNNSRAVFFGPEGDTESNLNLLKSRSKNYHHHSTDIRSREKVMEMVETIRPDFIVHCAGQPSHDLAAKIPFDDFEVNANGTLNILEAARKFCPESPFVFFSTNKVYGDGPNNIPLRELETRWDYQEGEFSNGIPENFSIDHCTHSLFGVSKASADLLVQEYGRYFNMPTTILRGGCLTGPLHKGVELHGFLNYLVKCNLSGKKYTIFGYKGKQVRDNIHSLDVSRLIWEIFKKPGIGAVFNLGGGKGNSCSILEAFRWAEERSGKKMHYDYSDLPRIGDHICYYSDLRLIQKTYPNWNISKSMGDIMDELVGGFTP